MGFPLIKNILSCVLAIAAVNLSNPFVPLFLLAKKAQKKKLGKKKYAVKGVSSSAEDDQRFAFGNHKLFEKSLTKTFSAWVCVNLEV